MVSKDDEAIITMMMNDGNYDSQNGDYDDDRCDSGGDDADDDDGSVDDSDYTTTREKMVSGNMFLTGPTKRINEKKNHHSRELPDEYQCISD